jgi:two-component system LytT family response regulator
VGSGLRFCHAAECVATAVTLRAVVIDDERPARGDLRRLLAVYREVEVVGDAAEIESAADLIAHESPDVVFLDVQLGPSSGFALLPHLSPRCKVVFVTAFDEYAIRAFDVNAVDYLLKPVHPDRLASTIRRLTAGESGCPPRLSMDSVAFLPCGSASAFLPVSSIACILADGDYSHVITQDGRKRAILRSLGDWERRLPADVFVRVHRSAIANLGAVSRVTPLRGGQIRLELRALEEPIVASRRFARRLRSMRQ